MKAREHIDFKSLQGSIFIEAVYEIDVSQECPEAVIGRCGG